jgi:hypothetical protein
MAVTARQSGVFILTQLFPVSMFTYRVIFRTCDTVNSVHGAKRPFGLDKTTLVKLCFLSLYHSIKDFPHDIFILGDKLSDDIQSFFKQFPVTLTNGVYGNDASIRQSIRLAQDYPESDWIYFCEDDYLHQPFAFEYIDELIARRSDVLKRNARRFYLAPFTTDTSQLPLFISPVDDALRYKPEWRFQSLLFLTRFNHWRQTSHTTFTFLTEGKTVRQFAKAMMESAQGARDGLLSRKLYGRLTFLSKGLCVSPIPALAAHMQENELSPLVDWTRLYERYKFELEQSSQ